MKRHLSFSLFFFPTPPSSSSSTYFGRISRDHSLLPPTFAQPDISKISQTLFISTVLASIFTLLKWQASKNLCLIWDIICLPGRVLLLPPTNKRRQSKAPDSLPPNVETVLIPNFLLFLYLFCAKANQASSYSSSSFLIEPCYVSANGIERRRPQAIQSGSHQAKTSRMHE